MPDVWAQAMMPFIILVCIAGVLIMIARAYQDRKKDK